MRASQIFRFVAIATITAAIVAALPAAARAQTITACSANKSGSMYRVGITGAPADCTNTSHKKETWNVQGPQGAQGAPGLSGLQVVKQEMILPPTKRSMLIVTCPAGKVAIGGGHHFSNSPQYRLWSSEPYSYDGGATYPSWAGDAENLSTTFGLAVTVSVICAKVSP